MIVEADLLWVGVVAAPWSRLSTSVTVVTGPAILLPPVAGLAGRLAPAIIAAGIMLMQISAVLPGRRVLAGCGRFLGWPAPSGVEHRTGAGSPSFPVCNAQTTWTSAFPGLNRLSYSDQSLIHSWNAINLILRASNYWQHIDGVDLLLHIRG